MPERSTNLLGSLAEEWDSGGRVLPGRSVQMWRTAAERGGLLVVRQVLKALGDQCAVCPNVEDCG